MMQAQIALNSHLTYAPRSEAQAEAASDALAAERLVERFADITWKTVAPVMALSLTFAVGVLAGAQFLAVHI